MKFAIDSSFLLALENVCYFSLFHGFKGKIHGFSKLMFLTWVWWCTPIVLAIQKVGAFELRVQDQPGQPTETPKQTNNKQISVSLYVMHHLSGCFPGFFFVFSFQKFMIF
jgi:hypothetical protein